MLMLNLRMLWLHPLFVFLVHLVTKFKLKILIIWGRYQARIQINIHIDRFVETIGVLSLLLTNQHLLGTIDENMPNILSHETLNLNARKFIYPTPRKSFLSVLTF